MYNIVYCDEFGTHLNLRDLDKWIDETNERLTEVEKKLSNDVKFTFKPGRIIFGSTSITDGFSAEVVDKKLYDKLEAKHEADCRLISEYDIENKKLEEKCRCLEKENKTFNVLLINKTETIGKLGNEYDKLKEQNAILTKENKKLTESNDTATKENLEFEGENDALSTRNAFLEDKIVTQKNRIASLESKLRNQRANLTSLQEKYEDATEQKDHYKNLFHSLNHNYQNLVGEMKNWKEKYESINIDYIRLEKDYNTVLSTKNSLEFRNAELESKLEKPEKLRRALEIENKALREALESVSKSLDKLNSDYYLVQENLKITKEKYEDAVKMNKAREDVYYANIKLQKTIEAKDREIGLLRAELDKYKTDDECDDRWID